MAENVPDRSREPPSYVLERNEMRTRKANLIPRRAWPQRGWTPESRWARSIPLLVPHELSALLLRVESSASIPRHPGGIDRHRTTGFAGELGRSPDRCLVRVLGPNRSGRGIATPGCQTALRSLAGHDSAA